jgi:methionyl aminopeptidase
MFRNQQAKPPELKSKVELEKMREAGRVVVGALKICRELAKPGVRTREIDIAVEAYYNAHNATPLFKGFPGKVPFPACTCLSINEQVVHGIPNDRVLKEGDILKVDTACKYNGWCADRAICIPIGTIRPERARLIKVAEEVLRIAIEEIPRRVWWSQVASMMQKHAESNGFTVVEDFVGHGIGRTMHENPQVPNYVSRDTRKSDFKFQPGLVLAVEPMVNMGRRDVRTLGDHWTVITKDGMPSVHVEHTLALTADNKVMVVTAEDEDDVFRVPRVL